MPYNYNTKVNLTEKVGETKHHIWIHVETRGKRHSALKHLVQIKYYNIYSPTYQTNITHTGLAGAGGWEPQTSCQCRNDMNTKYIEEQ